MPARACRHSKTAGLSNRCRLLESMWLTLSLVRDCSLVALYGVTACSAPKCTHIWLNFFILFNNPSTVHTSLRDRLITRFKYLPAQLRLMRVHSRVKDHRIKDMTNSEHWSPILATDEAKNAEWVQTAFLLIFFPFMLELLSHNEHKKQVCDRRKKNSLKSAFLHLVARISQYLVHFSELPMGWGKQQSARKNPRLTFHCLTNERSSYWVKH